MTMQVSPWHLRQPSIMRLRGKVERPEKDQNRPAWLVSLVAKRAKDKGITQVVFDRGGFRYSGRVKALADAAREAGLDF